MREREWFAPLANSVIGTTGIPSEVSFCRTPVELCWRVVAYTMYDKEMRVEQKWRQYGDEVGGERSTSGTSPQGE